MSRRDSTWTSNGLPLLVEWEPHLDDIKRLAYSSSEFLLSKPGSEKVKLFLSPYNPYHFSILRVLKKAGYKANVEKTNVKAFNGGFNYKDTIEHYVIAIEPLETDHAFIYAIWLKGKLKYKRDGGIAVELHLPIIFNGLVYQDMLDTYGEAFETLGVRYVPLGTGQTKSTMLYIPDIEKIREYLDFLGLPIEAMFFN